MNIHEYQAKVVLREFGVPVPRGIPAFSVDEAEKAARELGGPIWGNKRRSGAPRSGEPGIHNHVARGKERHDQV